jgi:hypothetical protein
VLGLELLGANVLMPWHDQDQCAHTSCDSLSFFPARRISPNETVTLGYLISGPEAKAVEMGDFKVTSAEWCD